MSETDTLLGQAALMVGMAGVLLAVSTAGIVLVDGLVGLYDQPILHDAGVMIVASMGVLLFGWLVWEYDQRRGGETA